MKKIMIGASLLTDCMATLFHNQTLYEHNGTGDRINNQILLLCTQGHSTGIRLMGWF